MIRPFAFAISLALLGAGQPVVAKPGDAPKQDTTPSHINEIAQGVAALQSGKPDEAVRIFEGVIAAYDRQYGPKVIFRCTSANMDKAIASAFGDALTTDKRDIVLGNEDWCTALWGKGFALIDLNRSAEAGPFLAKAVEMDPGNAHFINEYAEWFKAQQQFKRSKELFTQAWETVGHDKQGPDRKVAARSLRGIAFNLIELGDLDGAEKLYRQSLDYEPEAEGKVQQELDYIAEQRAKLKRLN